MCLGLFGLSPLPARELPDVLTLYRTEQTLPHVYSSVSELLGNTNVITLMTVSHSLCAIMK